MGILNHNGPCKVRGNPDCPDGIAEISQVIEYQVEIIPVAWVVPEPQVGNDQMVPFIKLYIGTHGKVGIQHIGEFQPCQIIGKQLVTPGKVYAVIFIGT